MPARHRSESWWTNGARRWRGIRGNEYDERENLQIPTSNIQRSSKSQPRKQKRGGNSEGGKAAEHWPHSRTLRESRGLYEFPPGFGVRPVLCRFCFARSQRIGAAIG